MSAKPARQVRAFPGLRNELLGEGATAEDWRPLRPSHLSRDKGCSRRPRRSTETRRILVSFPDKAT